jgi:flagellar motor switch protein FliG
MSAANNAVSNDVNGEDKAGSLSSGAGARKAAIALIMLGDELAATILSQLKDHEVEALLRTAADLHQVSPEEATEILEEYTGYFGNSLLIPPARGFVRGIAEETIGSDRVRSMLSEESESLLSEADKAGPDAMATVLKKEHPQTVAVALAVMDTEKAASVLTRLPADQRAEVVRRIAMMRNITPSLLREIGDTLRRELDTSSGGVTPVDGQSVVVSVLKSLDSENEQQIFEGLSETDPELSDEIRKRMFVFEDLITLDPRAMQMLLKEVDGRTLTMSLKTASSDTRDHILSCMSSRAATMIIEDLEVLGPVAVSQVETAQDEIIQIALRLASEGKITLR